MGSDAAFGRAVGVSKKIASVTYLLRGVPSARKLVYLCLRFYSVEMRGDLMSAGFIFVRKRNVSGLLAVVMVFAICVTVVEAQPTVTFPTPLGPGMQIPAGHNENPVDYGKTGFNFGWTYDTWQAYNAGSGNALIRMGPTSQGPGGHQAMQEDTDWAFHMEFSQSGGYPNSGDFFMYSKHSPPDLGETSDGREDRMFAISYGTHADSWGILVGNASGGWDSVVSGLTMDSYVDFDVHYKSGPKELDFYWDGSVVGTASTGHGRYDIDFLQVEELQQTGSTKIRNFRLGHIIPEPSSVLLVGLGAIGLVTGLRRRWA